jgi:formate hydrogenlyase subunit 6/NADH:ubiquinone oxidoreductase subunit I
MKFASMLREIVPSLVQAPITERYPMERRKSPARLRSILHWDPEACTGCGLCAMDCPSEAIEVIVLDRAAKRFALRLHLDRCAFCGQCTYSCRQGALRMSNDEWELASLSKGPLTLLFGRKEDVEEMLAATGA